MKIKLDLCLFVGKQMSLCFNICITCMGDLDTLVWLYTEQNYKHNTSVFGPIFHELKSKI